MSKRAMTTAACMAAMLTTAGCSGDDAEVEMNQIPGLELPAPRAAANHQTETPTIEGVEEFENEGNTTAVMRVQPEGLDWYMGMSATCQEAGAVLNVFLGPFPGTDLPVQLAVRGPDERTEHFGDILQGGPEHGFHSPILNDDDDIERFIELALQTGALISNGYNSFFNQADEDANAEFREALAEC